MEVVPSAQERVRRLAEAARAAAHRLQTGDHEVRVKAVLAVADAIWASRRRIQEANMADLHAAQEEGMPQPLLDRLALPEDRLALLVDGVRQVAEMPDPLGTVRRATRLDDGLDLYQVTVPIGVVGVVFESRPDALVQISVLALKGGNAALLKGGREAHLTNTLLAGIIREVIEGVGVPADAVQLLEGRDEVDALLTLDGLVDLVIPRGSGAFVKRVMERTRIPVLGHAEGVCHVYVHKGAELAQALAVVLDAKADHPAACNAAETVLVDRAVAKRFLPTLRRGAKARGIQLLEEGEDRFGVEFGDMRLAVGVVDGVKEAIDHINRYGSHHTDAILTKDEDAAARFVAGVDSASVMVNASTRFADGYRYGLGAEVGVSTSRIHARGPVGVDGLTTTKWIVVGNGQEAGTYQGEEARGFQHAPLPMRTPEHYVAPGTARAAGGAAKRSTGAKRSTKRGGSAKPTNKGRPKDPKPSASKSLAKKRSSKRGSGRRGR